MLLKIFTTVLALSTFPLLISTLGINCRGASECSIHESETDNGLYRLAQFVNTTMPNATYYDDGTKIACLQGSGDQNGGNGGLCAYLQNGANATGADLVVLMQGLLKHGCKKCGSIPTTPGNNVNDGELTVNWNSHANHCNGLCG